MYLVEKDLQGNKLGKQSPLKMTSEWDLQKKGESDSLETKESDFTSGAPSRGIPVRGRGGS